MIDGVEAAGCALDRAPAPRRQGRRRHGSGTRRDLPIKDMDEARLVLTDDLIRAALRREKAAKKERKAQKIKARAWQGRRPPKPARRFEKTIEQNELRRGDKPALAP